MNTNTKEAMKDFVSAVEDFAAWSLHTIGEENATKIVNAAEALKHALDKDETIP